MCVVKTYHSENNVKHVKLVFILKPFTIHSHVMRNTFTIILQTYSSTPSCCSCSNQTPIYCIAWLYSTSLAKAMAKYRLYGEVKREIDSLQIKYSCCGNKGLEDWFNLDWHKLSG